MKQSILFFLAFFLFSGYNLIFSQELSTNEIQKAAKLQGLKFDSKEIKQMKRQLSGFAEDFKQLRDFPLDNADLSGLQYTIPGLYANQKADQISISWPEVENVSFQSVKDCAFMSIPELAYLIKHQKISSLDLTKMYIQRLKKFDDSLHCVITITEERALKQAKKADQEIKEGKYRGLLHGIPYGIKDLFAVKGYPTSWGAMPFKDQIIEEDAVIIKKLDKAGAILIAKLTTGALAMGDVWYGGRTRNPWNLKQGSSGSSAGPASATVAGLVAFSIGTETLGSIVSPSTRCGATGLRPGYGRVSKKGGMVLSASMDKPGPICRNVIDCAIVLNEIRGSHPEDPAIVDAPFNFTLNNDVKKYRIAYLNNLFDKDYNFSQFDQKLIEKIQSENIELIPFSMPQDYPVNEMMVILNAEAAATFNELSLSNRDSLLVSQSSYSWPNLFRQARFIPAVEYILADRIRAKMAHELHEKLKAFDALLAPSFGGQQLSITNLSGHPCLVIPTAISDEKNLSSISLIGNYFEEDKLCEIGLFLERLIGFHTKHPPLFSN